MIIDIIIATYNRHKKVLELVNQILNYFSGLNKIIIVDSSDSENQYLKSNPNIIYIRSSHRNQPYQRYIGYLLSKKEILLFIDDDVEITDKQTIYKLIKKFEDINISGLALRIENKHSDTLLSRIPGTQLFKKRNVFWQIKGFLSGYPLLPVGKFGLCGNRGIYPRNEDRIEYINGAAFAARRSAMFQNFNFQLFDIFEKGLGMGEDAIIGYSLSKQGKLIYYDELVFLHNDQKDSTYIINIEAFAKRVAFSRLYLSLEKCRLDNRRLIIARLHYHYYMFWRLTGLVLNYLINMNKVRLQMLKGTFKGWILATKFKFDRQNMKFKYWHDEAVKDLSTKIEHS